MTDLRHADSEPRLKEAADVYEVLLALLATRGLTADDLQAAALDKRRTRGGFIQRRRPATDQDLMRRPLLPRSLT